MGLFSNCKDITLKMDLDFHYVQPVIELLVLSNYKYIQWTLKISYEYVPNSLPVYQIKSFGKLNESKDISSFLNFEALVDEIKEINETVGGER